MIKKKVEILGKKQVVMNYMWRPCRDENSSNSVILDNSAHGCHSLSFSRVGSVVVLGQGSTHSSHTGHCSTISKISNDQVSVLDQDTCSGAARQFCSVTIGLQFWIHREKWFENCFRYVSLCVLLKYFLFYFLCLISIHTSCESMNSWRWSFK